MTSEAVVTFEDKRSRNYTKLLQDAAMDGFAFVAESDAWQEMYEESVAETDNLRAENSNLQSDITTLGKRIETLQSELSNLQKTRGNDLRQLARKTSILSEIIEECVQGRIITAYDVTRAVEKSFKSEPESGPYLPPANPDAPTMDELLRAKRIVQSQTDKRRTSHKSKKKKK